MSKSNLGGYQRIVEWSKKVGGPTGLLIITAVTGYVVLRPLEEGIKRAFLFKKPPKEQKEHMFLKPGSYKDIKFKSGDRFTVLSIADDGALISIPNDKNSPYFVPVSFLKEFSDFN